MIAVDTSSVDFQDPQLLAALPQLFKDLSKSITLPALLALAQKFGGTHVHVPKKLNETSRLSSVLDRTSFSALIAHAGDEFLEIPRADAVFRQIRDCQIVKYRAAGHSVNETAGFFRMTERSIYYILKKSSNSERKQLNSPER